MRTNSSAPPIPWRTSRRVFCAAGSPGSEAFESINHVLLWGVLRIQRDEIPLGEAVEALWFGVAHATASMRTGGQPNFCSTIGQRYRVRRRLANVRGLLVLKRSGIGQSGCEIIGKVSQKTDAEHRAHRPRIHVDPQDSAQLPSGLPWSFEFTSRCYFRGRMSSRKKLRLRPYYAVATFSRWIQPTKTPTIVSLPKKSPRKLVSTGRTNVPRFTIEVDRTTGPTRRSSAG